MEKMTAQEREQKRAGEKETVDCMITIPATYFRLSENSFNSLL